MPPHYFPPATPLPMLYRFQRRKVHTSALRITIFILRDIVKLIRAFNAPNFVFDVPRLTMEQNEMLSKQSRVSNFRLRDL